VGAGAGCSYGHPGAVERQPQQHGRNSAENGALNTLVNNGNAATSNYAPAVQDYTKNLLGGGGATDQAGAVNQNYQNYYNQTNPLASNTNYNPI
jgi:hypothetical protein